MSAISAGVRESGRPASSVDWGRTRTLQVSDPPLAKGLQDVRQLDTIPSGGANKSGYDRLYIRQITGITLPPFG
ncbi:hypothetical protein [Arsenicibacter rosenii]|nr:hypothetical protein [Arsenicibacter rosenii]